MRNRRFRLGRNAIALFLMLPLLAGAQEKNDKKSGNASFSNEQLDQLTAQIALYPDALLSQVLMASTYPDEFAKAAEWSKAHPDTKGDEAVKMVEDKSWDPSVASLVAFPNVLITLGQKPDYVKNLGDAFLAQPDDVMDSVQRLRAQAKKAGNLKSNEQVKVTTQEAQGATPSQVIVVEPAQPSVVYVPTYNPATVYGAWAYPGYPPYYAPPPAGYWFTRTVATGIAWGVSIGVRNAMWGGFNWGYHNVNVNVNRYNNINVNRRIDSTAGRTAWHHNPQHRTAAYRGGDVARQRYDRQYQAGNRDQYRGRDMSRERASQAMESRGVDVDQSARRGQAQERAQNFDRDAARDRVQSADRSAAQDRAQVASRDNALRGAGSTSGGAQFDRGASSHRSAQGFSGGGARGRAGGGGRGGRR